MKTNKFLKVVERFEKVKKELKEVSEELTKELESLGVGVHFQDKETGIVYEVVQPKGTFVEYKTLTYNRTKTVEEVKGTLSKKRALELGYELFET